MSQITYNRYMAVAVPGLIADAQFTNKDGLQSAETNGIGLGLGVVQRVGKPNQGRLPKANKATIVFDADLVASNKINAKVNGVSMAEVTYATSHDATMAAIVTALKAVSGVANAVLDASDTESHTIIVYSNDGLDCIVSDVVVTGGSSQANATITIDTTDTIYGISILSQAIQQPYPALNEPILYKNGAPVGCLLRGRIWVRTETAVQNGDAVYMRFRGDGSVIVPASTTGLCGGVGVSAKKYATVAALASALGYSTGNIFHTIDGSDTQDGALTTAKGSGLVPGDSFKLTSGSTAVYYSYGYQAAFVKASGQFRGDDDSGTAVLVDGAVFRSVASAAGELALVEINQPQ